MSGGEVLIEAEGLWKKYSRDAGRSIRYGVADALRAGLGIDRTDRLRADEFWALSSIDLAVRRGEVLGLCGHNGSGKTTLLKTMSGLLQPDRGAVTMRGRIGWLVDIGAGLNPRLTGRENIFLRADMIGHRGDRKRLCDEFEDFARLGPFLDSAVAFYSAGMKARLGFGIATMVEPDILIIDETLAVGDLAFRIRCYDRVARMSRNAAVLFVSHGMNHVARICTRGLFLDGGRILQDGAVSESIRLYNASMTKGSPLDPGQDSDRVSLCLRGPGLVNQGASLSFRVALFGAAPGAGVRVIGRDLSGAPVLDSSSRDAGFAMAPGDSCLDVTIATIDLAPGIYDLSAWLENAEGVVMARSAAVRLRIDGASQRVSPYQPIASWRPRAGEARP
ncbi:MAG: ABC transporter ATP-binding protein [Pseudomonadota bacterium]